jgi:DNA modification methylase
MRIKETQINKPHLPEALGGRKQNNTLNDLSAKEWIKGTVSVFIQKGLGANHSAAQIEKQHPAPFSFQDVGRLITFFTKSGAMVLDPFVGVGSTLKACAMSGRKGVGIELNRRFVSLSNTRLTEEIEDDLMYERNQKVILGDALEVLKEFEDETFDFIVTSPPYWNILKKADHKVTQERISKHLSTDYGNDKRDPSNAETYDKFLDHLCAIFKEAIRTLKKSRYMCVIVSDFRHKEKYYIFHSDLAYRLSQLGLSLKGITILYQKHKRVFPYGYPYSFVPNIHHQYILVLQKTA